MGDSTRDIELVKAFAKRSISDLHSAKSLLDSGDYADSAYHAQQCAEKIVKCVLILKGNFLRTHMTSGLFSEVVEDLKNNEWKQKLENLIPEMISLERHWILPRYPEPDGDTIWNPVDEYTKSDAKDAIEKAEFVFKTLKEFMKEVYEVEVEIRK